MAGLIQEVGIRIKVRSVILELRRSPVSVENIHECGAVVLLLAVGKFENCKTGSVPGNEDRRFPAACHSLRSKPKLPFLNISPRVS